MRDRDRKTIRDFVEAERQEQERLEEERMKPIRDAEQQYNEIARKLHAIEGENLLKLRDDAFQLDPATTRPIPIAQVPNWQKRQADEFKASHPDYWPSPQNEVVLVDYINRNHPGIRLVSTLQLSRAFMRLGEFGLLQERPEPASEPTQEPEPVTTPQPAAPIGYQGWDLETGEPRVYSEFEVNKMDSTDYKRRFRLSQPKITDVLFPGN